MDLYTTLAAERCSPRGAAPASSISSSTRRPRSSATTSLRRGIGDGAPGLIISAMNAHYVFLSSRKLWALGRAADGAPEAATGR